MAIEKNVTMDFTVGNKLVGVTFDFDSEGDTGVTITDVFEVIDDSDERRLVSYLSYDEVERYKNKYGKRMEAAILVTAAENGWLGF